MQLKYGPYSPSRLETATCGFQFFHTYVEPKPDARREGLAQGRGSAVHEVFEQITEHLKTKKDVAITDADIRKWVTEAINRHPVAYQELADVMEMARKYIARPYENLTENSEIELRLAVKFEKDAHGNIITYEDLINDVVVTRPSFIECDYNDPEAVARGRADVLTISDDTTTAFILDHKTQPNVEEADTFQLGFYAWVISRIYPFLEEVQTTLHFARYGRYSDPYVWSKEDLYRIEDQFLTRLGIIESKQTWDAVPYKNCQYCPFVMDCPVMKEYLDVNAETGDFRVKMDNLYIIKDTSKAVKMAGFMNVIDELSNKIQKGLREFVKEVGPIAIPGKIFEFRGQDKIDWKKLNTREDLRIKAYEIFEKHKIDPKYFMGFSETFSKNVWMLQNEALVKELAELFPRRTEVEFKGYKA